VIKTLTPIRAHRLLKARGHKSAYTPELHWRSVKKRDVPDYSISTSRAQTTLGNVKAPAYTAELSSTSPNKEPCHIIPINLPTRETLTDHRCTHYVHRAVTGQYNTTDQRLTATGQYNCTDQQGVLAVGKKGAA
jgi:hypothetical protein